jgi:hypothetical protein
MFHLSLSKHGSSYSRLVNGFVTKATRRVRYVEECGYRHNALVALHYYWSHVYPTLYANVNNNTCIMTITTLLHISHSQIPNNRYKKIYILLQENQKAYTE